MKARTKENMIDGGTMRVGLICAESKRKAREGIIGAMTNTITRTRTKMEDPAITTGGIDTTVAIGDAVPLGQGSAVGRQRMREALDHETSHGQVH